MRTFRIAAALGPLALVGLVQAVPVQAADLRVISTIGVKSFVEELAPQFERTTGHKLSIKFGTANVLKREIEAGEPFDVAIMTAMVTDDLIKQGRLVAATRTDIARGGIGVGVRAGLSKPDISTVDALKKALLDAKSITYAKEGASGIYFAGLIQKWGLTDALKGKTLLGAGNVGEIAARGEADMAVQLITELISVKGLELVGPLPAEVQNWVVLTAGVSSNLKEPGAAIDFIKFLTAPAAVPVLKAKGLEPGSIRP